MAVRLIVSFCVLLYALGVPILEINETHVFNPDWTPHVRIHEVWQLLTNSALGLLCLWLIWARSQIAAAAILSLLVTGGFLIAFAIKDFYGGSMKYLDGTEKTVLDINVGAVGFGLAVILLLLALAIEAKRKRSPEQ